MRQLPIEKYIEHSSTLPSLMLLIGKNIETVLLVILLFCLSSNSFNPEIPTVRYTHARSFVSLSFSLVSLETWWRLCERNVYSRLAELLPTVAGIMLDKGAVQEWNFLTETIKRRYPRNRIAATSVSFLANKTESILAPVCCIPLVKYRNFLSVAPLFDTGLAPFLSPTPIPAAMPLKELEKED